MNLNAYDNVTRKLDKRKTWYSLKFKRLYSREIKFRMFYKFLQRWNESIKRNDYFLAVSMYNTDGTFTIANKDNVLAIAKVSGALYTRWVRTDVRLFTYKTFYPITSNTENTYRVYSIDITKYTI